MRDPDRGAYEDWGDVELIILSWDEPEAFGVLFERHAEDLLRYFARRPFDPEAAAELTAETFAQAFASRRRFRDRGLGGSDGSSASRGTSSRGSSGPAPWTLARADGSGCPSARSRRMTTSGSRN